MIALTFREVALTANRYAMDHINEGAIVRFDVGHGDNNTLEIVLEDSNNDYGRKYPYTIRFVTKAGKDGSITFKPFVNQRFVKDFGLVGKESLIYQFQKKLFRKMALRW